MTKRIGLKVICMIIFLSLSINNTVAQDKKGFEGEISFETYENYSVPVIEMHNSIYFNGVHKVRLILKENKMHLIDETTKCHIIADDNVLQTILNGGNTEGNGYVHYCDFTKTGLNSSNLLESVAFLSKIKSIYSEITEYNFQKTDTLDIIGGKKCNLYKGIIKRTCSGFEINITVEAYLSEEVAPTGYAWNVWGLHMPNIAMKWIIKYDGGHIGNVGELSLYVEADVTNIQPRNVSDKEFEIPTDYKIRKAGDPLVMLKYYKGIKKHLERLGIKGCDKSQKSTEVHYKTIGEWDY